MSTPPPPFNHHQGAFVTTRPLRVAPSLRSAGAPATHAELLLRNALVPPGGGIFRFDLYDANAPEKTPVTIGQIAFEGSATTLHIRRLRVHAEFNARAVAFLQQASSPTIRIVPRRANNAPLGTESIELHAAP